MEQLNVVCFLWDGVRWDVEAHDGYLYVNKLYRAVQKHLSIPHRFICMTNLDKTRFDSGIEILPLNAPSWKGCLPKVCMFDPALGLTGRVFSLDIDIIITGSLDEMAQCESEMIVRSSFKFPELLDGDIVGFKVSDEIAKKVWSPLKDDPALAEEITGGRERYWYRHIFGKNMDRYQTEYPNQLVSYKRHMRGSKVVPKNVRIVSCHGRPRPHELRVGWALKNWKEL